MYADLNRVSATTGGDHTQIASSMVNSVAPPADNVDLSGTTTNFISDANVSSSTIQHSYDIGDMFKNTQSYTQQDICEFLRKPVRLSSGDFGPSDTGILQTYNPYHLLNTQPIWANKTSGHLAVRADLHVRLVLNATRFQQGRYCLAWFPTVGASATLQQTNAWFNMHCANLTNRTQLPHVEIDINRDTECTMVIPFISAYSHKFLGTNTFTDPGQLVLFPYSAIQAPTGSTTASYTIYVHFENVKLDAPTQPQSNVRFKKSGTVQEQEQKAGGIGPIGGVLTKVSKATGLLAQIPLLSSVAAPVSWFTDILASAANVFGWSSPLDLSEVTRAVQTIVPFSNNVDMPDGSMPLSLFARNTLEVLPGIGGTDIDEMAIDHIKTIPAYYTQFNLNTTDTSTQIVAQYNACYSLFYSQMVDNGRTVTVYTPLSYLALFFNQARGGIVFKFKVCSTEFHSGRYSVTFTPYEAQGGGPTVNASGQDYVHREIIDLRMGCEFTFCVPYTSITNYRYLTGNINECFGAIAITAVNPLKAPSTVSQVVPVLVEVCGAPDIEFAALRTGGQSICAPSAPQSNIKFVSSVNEITSGQIGNSQTVDDNMLSSRHCVGERLLSLTSLLKHTDQLIPTTQGTTALGAVIDPFFIVGQGYVGAVQSDSPWRSDLYSMITSMYAMSRGSMRYRIFNNGGTSANTLEENRAFISYDTTNTPNNPIVETTTAFTDGRWRLSIIQNQIYRGCVEVQTPPYHHTFARTNVNSFYGSGLLSGNRSNPSSNKMILNVETSAANGCVYKRQVADDFQCSMFISTPATTSF